MIIDSLDKTWLSLCWCRYAQSLSVALLWEKMLECLIVKSLWAPRIFYLLWWDNSPFKLISLPSRYSFAQPVRFSLYISRAPSFQPIQIEKLMTDLIRDGLPCWHRKELGLVVLNRIKDIYMYNLQNFEICIQNGLPSSRGPNHIHISLSTLDTSIDLIYICWDLSLVTSTRL